MSEAALTKTLAAARNLLTFTKTLTGPGTIDTLYPTDTLCQYVEIYPRCKTDAIDLIDGYGNVAKLYGTESPVRLYGVNIAAIRVRGAAGDTIDVIASCGDATQL